MIVPKILVTSAAGHTGSSAVLELLKKGFPVRAFVRRRDARAETLEKAGAELAFGDLFDFHDIRKAMVGVQRAYHVPPFAPNLLEGAMLFAAGRRRSKTRSRRVNEPVASPSCRPVDCFARTLDCKPALSLDAVGGCRTYQPGIICFRVHAWITGNCPHGNADGTFW